HRLRQSWSNSLDIENTRRRQVSFDQNVVTNIIDNIDTQTDDGVPNPAREWRPIRFHDRDQSDFAKEDIGKLLEFFHEKMKSAEDLEGFLWRDRRPRALYHADTTVQSLEDTPQVFKLKQTRNVNIRPNLKKY